MLLHVIAQITAYIPSFAKVILSRDWSDKAADPNPSDTHELFVQGMLKGPTRLRKFRVGPTLCRRGEDHLRLVKPDERILSSARNLLSKDDLLKYLAG